MNALKKQQSRTKTQKTKNSVGAVNESDEL